MALNRWWKWLTRKSRPARRPAAPHRRSRPTLETLEERAVPTVLFNSALGGEQIYWSQTGQTVTGPLSSNPTAVQGTPYVYFIFWGPSWTTSNVQPLISGAQTILQDSYTARLTDYGATGLAAYGDYLIDNSSIPSRATTPDPIAATNEIAAKVPFTSWRKPQSSSPVDSPIYVVVTDNYGGGAGNGPDSYPGGLRMNHIWIGDQGNSAQSFDQLFSHELAERISSGTDQGIRMNAPVNAGTDGEWQNAQIADNEPDGTYYYPLEGTVPAQAYWSLSARAFVVPDGNSETIVLTPHWNLSTPTSPRFQGTFDLNILGDSSASAAITLDVSQSGPTAGELRITDNSQVFWFPTSQLSSITVTEASSGTNIVNVLRTPTGVPVSIIGHGSDTVNLGVNGSVQGIGGNVTITNPPYFTTLNVDDSNDPGSRATTVLTAPSDATFGEIDGLLANGAFIRYKYNDTNSVTIRGGSGNNTYNITGVVPTVTLYTGAGTDTVAIPNSVSSLVVNAQGAAGRDTVNIGSNAATTFGGVINGAAAVHKVGTGTATLTGANTYTGATFVDAGTLLLGAASSLPQGTPLTVASGAVFDPSNFSPHLGSLAGAGTVRISGGAPLYTGADNTSTTFSGVINGFELRKEGTGTLTLGGSYQASGLTVQSGTVRVGSATTFSTVTGVSVENGATFDLNNFNVTIGLLGYSTPGGRVTLGSGNLTINTTFHSAFFGTISGTGGLIKSGTGLLTLGGTNTYSGPTTVNQGQLDAFSTSALSANTALTVAAGATFNLNNLNLAVGSLAGAGNVTLGYGTLTTGTDNSSTTFSGVISGSGRLTKVGSGALTLSGNNLFTGGTSVTGGTLVVNGTVNTVNLGAGTTLAGTGNAWYPSGAGTVSPGTSSATGILTTLFPALDHATLRVRLNGTTPGAGYDQLGGIGTVALNGSATLSVNPGFTSPLGTTFTILQAYTGGFYAAVVAGTFAGLPDGAVFTAGGQSFRINYITNSIGGAVTLTHVLASTVTTLTSSGASVYGQPVTLTAAVAVSGSGSAAGGTVTYFDGATTLGTAVVDASGHAALATPTLAAGGHSLTAVFAATGALGSSTSAALAQAVSPAPLTITADDQAKVAGDPVPTLTARYSGFVLGQTPAVLTTPVTLTTYTGDTAGGYDIVPSGATAANYTITFVRGTLTVTPAAASTFVVSGFPSQVTAGDNTNQVTVTAYDAYGNVATGYSGTVHFASSDGQAALPADTTLTNGTGSFSVTLFTAGSQSLTATDTVSGSITGTQPGITVTPAVADHLLFLQPPTDTAAGQTLGAVSVAIVDAFGNVLTSDGSDTVTLSLGVDPSGGTATLSGTLTVTVVNGVATFSDLSIDLAGNGYTLHATIGGGLPDIDSSAFSIT
jgi:autotransporter-associated beta strand protein